MTTECPAKEHEFDYDQDTKLWICGECPATREHLLYRNWLIMAPLKPHHMWFGFGPDRLLRAGRDKAELEESILAAGAGAEPGPATSLTC
ncbi:hypothetical protein [Rhizohabitans arisaemae]|uniref:hypothetical protein n=1 Tax=Rhizohabitans arisaemae TaxID=2720610 RepID=UPI0024B200C7|nr:hypothetical protein [Rhizohabitans arisaemae]